MKGGEELIDVVVLDEWQSLEWETIDWRHDHSLFIHSLMVHLERQGQGNGKAMLHASEQFAKTEGYTSIRLDSFSNEAACNFYKRHGYVERGSVHFDSKPKGYERYICSEKALD